MAVHVTGVPNLASNSKHGAAAPQGGRSEQKPRLRPGFLFALAFGCHRQGPSAAIIHGVGRATTTTLGSVAGLRVYLFLAGVVRVRCVLADPVSDAEPDHGFFVDGTDTANVVFRENPQPATLCIMDTHEKRLHPRKDVFSAAMLVVGDRGYLSEVWDLSQGGARVGRPKNWPGDVGEPFRIFFMLDQDTVISLLARVVRNGADSLGVQFVAGQEQRIHDLMYEARFLDSDVA